MQFRLFEKHLFLQVLRIKEHFMKKKIKSPCQLICTYDSDNVCVGCFRSTEEVTNWDNYTDDEKKQVLENIAKRREVKGGGYYGFG